MKTKVYTRYGQNERKKPIQSIYMKLKSKLFLTTASWGAKGASAQTSSVVLASIMPTVSACAPWRGAILGEDSSSKSPLWGSLALPLTSAFPRRRHRLFLGDSNWRLPSSPLMRGTTEFGFQWTLTNFSFVMYANFPSKKLIGSSNLLRDSHTVCKNPW